MHGESDVFVATILLIYRCRIQGIKLESGVVIETNCDNLVVDFGK